MTKFARLSLAAILALGLSPAIASASNAASGTITCAHDATSHGFNRCGYNYSARIFSGPADGVDKKIDGMVYGDPTYANDHLVMKWNAAWDACNANGYDDPTYCQGAWVTNEWNGMATGGSSTTEHVKIIWVGSAAAASPYWVTGGDSIWGNYETIMDQGMVDGQHTVWTFASPNGLSR
ncbi:MAG TPA: hypothetical protein VMV52_08065 [Candidatus Nanopelagicaceae bacterium]|nr:hypothetical protein [Candidatus Nanopelagicaceae bacterium]